MRLVMIAVLTLLFAIFVWPYVMPRYGPIVDCSGVLILFLICLWIYRGGGTA